MRLSCKLAPYLALILALFVSSFSGRAQDFRGSLIGTVNDSSGGRIPSAVIIIQARESSMERRATSDNRGEFRFSDLAPATYRVTVQAPGFADASASVTVSVSSARDITVTMHTASSQ